MRGRRSGTRRFYPAPAALATSATLTLAIATAVASAGCKRKQADATPGLAVPTPPGRAAYVTNNGSDSVSVLDRDGPTVTTVPVDIDPDEKEAPHHLAVDAKRGEVFVALSFPAPPKPKKDPHGGHGNAESHGKLARLRIGNLAITETRDVDFNPGDVLLSHDGSKVLVSHFDMRRAMNVAAAGGATGTMFASLQLWDARALKLVASRGVCVAPHGIATTADDRMAVVACYGSDEVALVDLAAPGMPTARFPLGTSQGVPGAPSYGPYSVVLAKDGVRAVVATLEASDVRVFDLAARRFLPDKTVFLHARAFFPDFVEDDVVIVPTQAPDGLARVDVAKAAVDKRVPLAGDHCKSPHAVKRAKDGRVYVVCEGDHVGPGAILEIDPATLATKRRWEVGVYPDGIAFGDGP